MNLVRSIVKFHLMFFIATMLTFSITETAFASDAADSTKDPIGPRLCKVIMKLRSGTARAIAMIAVMMLAVGAFTGRLQWTTVMVTLIGILIIFKAEDLVKIITGDSSAVCEEQQATQQDGNKK